MGNLGIAVFWGRSMKSNTNNYVDKYIMLCSQLCKTVEDYANVKVAKHNRAVKKLIKLKEQMYADDELTEKVYKILLSYEDTHVQQSAATDCLRLNIYTNTSVKILKSIIQNGDRMSAMGAERTLLIWEGKLSPDKPF